MPSDFGGREMYFLEHLGFCFILMAIGFLLYREQQRRQPGHFVYGFVGVAMVAEGFLASMIFVLAYWAVYGFW